MNIDERPLDLDMVDYLEKLRQEYETADTYQKAASACRRLDTAVWRLLPSLIVAARAYWTEKNAAAEQGR